jgi:hypothetical protein
MSSAPWTPRLVGGNPLAVAVEMEQLILANMVLHDLVIFVSSSILLPVPSQ